MSLFQKTWPVVLMEDAMIRLFYLSTKQPERAKPFFPLSHGASRAGDLGTPSGIIYAIRHGPQWKEAPCKHSPYKTLYGRFLRWSRMGAFNNILAEPAKTAGNDGQLMMPLKARRIAVGPLKKGLFSAAPDAQRED